MKVSLKFCSAWTVHKSLKIYSNLSIILNPKRSPFSHPFRKHVRTAFGRTYNAISPLLFPFSIQILHPQVKQPAIIPPKGPSQKLCETKGRSLARTRVRVKQTENQKRAMKLERNVELRREPRSFWRRRWGCSRLFGFVRRTGRMCTWVGEVRWETTGNWITHW
jgi:hypothetical protein